MAQRKQARHAALALLEFESVALGVRATDLMVKGSPIALLRCGTIHPGRYLALVGGSVASTEAAYRIGVAEGENDRSLRDAVLLADVHPAILMRVMVDLFLHTHLEEAMLEISGTEGLGLTPEEVTRQTAEVILHGVMKRP